MNSFGFLKWNGASLKMKVLKLLYVCKIRESKKGVAKFDNLISIWNNNFYTHLINIGIYLWVFTIYIKSIE